MKKTAISFIAALAVLCAFSVSAKDTKIPDSAIVQLLIDDSGNCPCPYNAMRNGRSCGKRSAYSKPADTRHCASKKTSPKPWSRNTANA